MYVLRQFLLICFLLVAGPGIVSAQTAGYRHFTVKDGLAGNHVYMTHQDKEGYIWIATTSGLSRFDGRHFQNYDYENGLPDNEVLFVTNDHANRIWIHSFAANNALSVIEKVLPVKRYSLKAANLSEQYYSDGNKTTYLTGFHSLVVVRGSHAPVWTQLPFDAGRVWETEDGLCYLSDGRSIFTIKDTVVRFLQQLTSYPVGYSRMYYYRGLLYAVSGKTLQTFVYGHRQFRYIATTRFDAPINQVHVNKYGIWITYKDQQGGCLFTRDGEWSLQYRFSLPGFINYISDDAEGGVWLSSSDNGLFYMPAPDFVNYTIADGLASSVVSALEPVRGSKLWLGYNTGQAELVCYSKKALRKERSIMVEQSSSNGFVMDITSAGKYGVLLLSRKNFLQLRDKATYLKAPGVNKSISLLNDTVVGVGGWKYWLYHLNTKLVTEYPISRIYAQCTDIHGNYWLGGMEGLYRIDGHTSGYQKLKALDGYKINALVSCQDYLWAGTQNNGLYLLRNGRIVAQLKRSSNEGVASNTIKALAAREDRLYIGTNKGDS
ncbi:MAG: two-component regulator propeller domain-containing protein [Chitinophagaceae bacterium]